MKHLLRMSDLTKEEILEFIERGMYFKKVRGKSEHPKPLTGKTVGLLFDKPSTRTRISIEVGIIELGGNSLFLQADSLQLSRGEEIGDTAMVLSRYLHGVVIRTGSHRFVEEFARASSIPVINGLTELFHPLQVLADLMTVKELKGEIENLRFAFVGDGNNMANTYIETALIMGFELRVATPPRFRPLRELMDRMNRGRVYWTSVPEEAVAGADVIITDVWVSMGQEKDARDKEAFKGFQVNSSLLERASPSAIVLHCLPAHKGEEISEEVFKRFEKVLFDCAENRLHTQKAVLERFVGMC
jgi:ornithine carbamoyltransferase